jgi:hypothetical protein
MAGAPAMSLGVTNYLMQSVLRAMTSIQCVGFFSFFNVNSPYQTKFLLDGAYAGVQQTIPSPSSYLKAQFLETAAPPALTSTSVKSPNAKRTL